MIRTERVLFLTSHFFFVDLHNGNITTTAHHELELLDSSVPCHLPKVGQVEAVVEMEVEKVRFQQEIPKILDEPGWDGRGGSISQLQPPLEDEQRSQYPVARFGRRSEANRSLGCRCVLLLLLMLLLLPASAILSISTFSFKSGATIVLLRRAREGANCPRFELR